MIDSETQTDDILINGISFIEFIKNNNLYNVGLDNSKEDNSEEYSSEGYSDEEDSSEGGDI